MFEFIGEQHIEFVVYAFFYDHYRFFDLDPKSLFVWIAAMLGTDHGYYWYHRFLHETNIGWSSHQVHHSSEARDSQIVVERTWTTEQIFQQQPKDCLTPNPC